MSAFDSRWLSHFLNYIIKSKSSRSKGRLLCVLDNMHISTLWIISKCQYKALQHRPTDFSCVKGTHILECCTPGLRHNFPSPKKSDDGIAAGVGGCSFLVPFSGTACESHDHLSLRKLITLLKK